MFNSRPVADLFKESVKKVNEELYELTNGTYKFPGDDFSLSTPEERAISKSFADHFFTGFRGMSHSMHIYHYAWMDAKYFETYRDYMCD